MPAINEETLQAFLSYGPAIAELEDVAGHADNKNREEVATLGMVVLARHWNDWAKTVDPPEADVIQDMLKRIEALEAKSDG